MSHFLDSTGSWRSKEIAGSDSLSSWEACWRVFRTAAITCDLAAPAVLDRYAAAFRTMGGALPGQLAIGCSCGRQVQE